MSADIIQEPGFMAVRVPEHASDFRVEEPSDIAFSTFQLVYLVDQKEESQSIDSNVQFSDVSFAGKTPGIEDTRLKAWCEKMGIGENESYALLRLKY
jgi:hypothetical protein